MEKKFNEIKNVLKSSPFLIIDKEGYPRTEDNRITCVKRLISNDKKKNTQYYNELLKVLAYYVNEIYDRDILYASSIAYNKNGEAYEQEWEELNSFSIRKIIPANHQFAIELFNYICDILEENPDVTLDTETLIHLLNRNPKLFELTVDQSYLYRLFNFERLASILEKNDTIKKSNISLDNIYDILIKTCQINNEEIFKKLVNSEQFKSNHEKIDEIMKQVNSKIFAEIYNIIVNNFDKEYDGKSILKNRKNDNYIERVIISLLGSKKTNETFNFIHTLLSDDDLTINYDCSAGDYYGPSDLKSLIALSNNRTIIADMLKDEKNIQQYYDHGSNDTYLYQLYAIIGDYDKAVDNFLEHYNQQYDFSEEYENDFNNKGFTYASLTHKDSLVIFLNNLNNSFIIDEIDYEKKRDIIYKTMNNMDNMNIKYIDLDKTLTILNELLDTNDFKALLKKIIKKYNNGELYFTEVKFNVGFEDINEYYIIKLISSEKLNNKLDEYNLKGKTLINKKKDIE